MWLLSKLWWTISTNCLLGPELPAASQKFNIATAGEVASARARLHRALGAKPIEVTINNINLFAKWKEIEWISQSMEQFLFPKFGT